MRYYKLLKDTPIAKAGEIFQQSIGIRGGKEEPVFVTISHSTAGLWANDIKNFDDWFEEIYDVIWAINTLNSRIEEISNTQYSELAIENLKSLGLLFATEEEAEKHLERLKARAILIQDTKGFKPDWSNINEEKYYGVWNAKTGELDCLSRMSIKHDDIYFETVDDIGYSFKTHEKEWKIYLGVEK
jgi:hypothetical protein